MPNRDDLNTPMIAIIGFLSAILLFVIIVGMQAWFYSMQNAEFYKKVVTKPQVELNTLISGQQEMLNSYRWIDKDKQIAGIPIDRAMELVAREPFTASPVLNVQPQPKKDVKP